jgi:hypothetical protein
MTPLNTNRHYGPGTHIQQNYVIGILYNVYIPIQYLYCKQKKKFGNLDFIFDFDDFRSDYLGVCETVLAC